MYTLKLLFLFLLTIIFTQIIATCSQKPENTIDREVFSEIVAEFITIEKLAISEVQKSLMYENIFARYNTTPELFLATKKHYQNDPEFWIEIYKNTQSIIKEKMAEKEQS
jgi:hypothetical protein